MEALLRTLLQVQILLSSWYHQLANSDRSNKHHNPHQPQTLTQHLLKAGYL
jgi:hypothetical protein